MAVKEPEAARKGAEIENAGESAATDNAVKESPAKRKAAKPPELNADNFCVYIGPTIHGVIQSGAVYSGTRKDAEKLLASVIEQYPLIATLIVTDETLAEDRIKVKTAGNQLNVLYMKLASGQRTV